MKLGIVGVGPWGRVLAGKFQSLGHEIVCYDRARMGMEDLGLGHRSGWQEMVRPGKGLDAVIAAGGPEINLAVVRAAVLFGMPVFATKPLMLEAPLKLTAPLMVDYTRLDSACYKLLRLQVGARGIESAQVSFYGNGPVRPFSGLEDYGSHAIAFLARLPNPGVLTRVDFATLLFDDGAGKELYRATGRMGCFTFDVVTGNGGKVPRRHLIVRHEGGSESEYVEEPGMTRYLLDGEVKLEERNADPLRLMVSRFVDSIGWAKYDKPFIDPGPMHLSVQVTETLKKIRTAAAPTT